MLYSLTLPIKRDDNLHVEWAAATSWTWDLSLRWLGVMLWFTVRNSSNRWQNFWRELNQIMYWTLTIHHSHYWTWMVGFRISSRQRFPRPAGQLSALPGSLCLMRKTLVLRYLVFIEPYSRTFQGKWDFLMQYAASFPSGQKPRNFQSLSQVVKVSSLKVTLFICKS